MTELFDDVVNIVAATLDKTPAEVKVAVTLEDLDADSLDLMDMIMTCEQVYGIKVEDKELEGIETVAHLVALVQRHQE